MDIATLGLEIRSDGVVVAGDRLNKFGQDAGRAEKATDGLSRAFRVLGPLIGAVTAAFSVRALVQYADAWSDMSSRVGAAIKDMDSAPQMMRRLVEVANASYSPLEQTVEIYSRNVAVLSDLGRNAAEAADFTESLNHMLVITATRGERAASVQGALSKAMAVGKLQADGLETVLANGGRVAQALADELGTTVSGLRDMASQGKITGDVIANALLKSLDDVRIEAGEMDATIGDAMVRVGNNTTALIGTLDKAWGASRNVADAILGMADGILASTDTFLRLGNVIGSIVGPAFDVLSSSMAVVGQYSGIALAALAGFYAPALIGGVAALTAAIGVGLVGAIRAVGVAMMANPLGLFIAALAAGVTAAFMFRDEIEQAIGVDLVGVVKDGANATIGAFVGAYDAIVATWGMLPAAIGDLVITAVNGLIGAVESMLNNIIGKMNNFMNDIRQKAYDMGQPLPDGVGTPLAPVEFDRVQNPNAGAAGAAADVAGAAFKGAQGDYIGELGKTLGEVWTNAEGATDAMLGLADAAGGGGSGGGAGGSGKKNPYADLVRGANEFIAAQGLEAQALGMTAEAANRMRYEQDLLNQAANDNINLSPGQRQELSALAESMSGVEERTRSLTEWYNIGRTTFGSFMSDFKRDLMGGTSLWESFGNAAAKALDSIADRALSMAANGIFDMLFGAVMGGITGGIGGGMGSGMFGASSITGSSGGFFPGFANGTNSAPGGMAWVGERGPELVNLPQGSQVIPNQQSMAMAANSNGGGDINITNQINVPAGTTADVAPAIAREVTKELRKQLPDAIQSYNRNPLRRVG